MLSSHCENIMQLPYAAVRRAAVLVDHHRRYRSPNAAEVAPSCPRCDSPNTKFCYYNNYSLSQPRYFCKGCRRYWTKGGSLRNVPVGGGCRKNRRAKSSAARSHLGSATVSADAGVPFSRRFPGAAVRPDLLLEGMVGGPAGLGAHLQPVNAAEKPDGSAIDLALLYAKFLNHQPSAAVVTESADTSSDTSPNDVLPPDHPFVTSQDGFGHLSAPHCPDSRAEALGELGFFSMDQSCYDSLGFPSSTDDGISGDLMLPSTWRHRPAAKYELFDPLPEDAMGLHHDGGSIAGAVDDVWSHALACQGLEAALCRP